jgi:hypothetical protein
MVTELGRRGRGERESGAFLLSPRDRDGRTVIRVVYLDDLDPDCLVGAIHLAGSAYPKLWSLCDREQLRVVADAHTHPGACCRQSPIDQDNPMVARAGHLALIIPDLARRPITPRDVGVHEYLGDAGWRSWYGTDAAQILYMGWA